MFAIHSSSNTRFNFTFKRAPSPRVNKTRYIVFTSCKMCVQGESKTEIHSLLSCKLII